VPGCVLSASCISLVSLDNRSCPCATGYTCCDATQLCLEPDEICSQGGGGSNGSIVGQGGRSSSGGSSGAGAGGTAGTRGGTSPQAGAGDGTAGASGEAGAGGVGEPTWRPVGPEVLDDFPAAGEPDLEIAPDGTPYVAFLACGQCDAQTRAWVPAVQRFDGSWHALPIDGLPATIASVPELAIGDDGTLHLVTDVQVSSFDGRAWRALSSDLPRTTTDQVNFQIDDDGVFWTTLWDESRQGISVVRWTGTGWETFGPAVSGDITSMRLVVGPGGPYLAHAAVDAASVSVRHFPDENGDWASEDFLGVRVELAQAQSGELYVAVWRAPDQVTVLSGAAGALVFLGTLRASWRAPGLQVAPDGAPHVVYLLDDFVNVNRWDGTKFVDVDSSAIGNGTGPVLRLLGLDGSIVPFVAFQFGAALKVKKYE
jgi:hypothetical protein